MKILCSKNVLQEEIQIVQKAVSTKTTLPVLSGIFMQTENNRVKLTATDTEIGIQSYLHCDVIEDGKIVVPAKYFGEIIRRLPDDKVEITVNEENHSINIKCKNAEFNLNGYDPADFPPLSHIDDNIFFTMDQLLLKTMIKQTIFAISTNDTRPIFTGILLQIEDNDLTLVATDTHRLAVKKGKINGEGINASVVVPGKTMNEVSRILQDDDQLEVRIGDRQISFQIGEVNIISRLLEGQFPNYKAVVPKDFRIKTFIDGKTFLESVERAALLSKDSGNIIKLHIQGSKMVIESSNPEVGNTHEEIGVETNGDEIKIAFNSKYISDVLKVIDTESVIFDLSDSLSPGVIRPYQLDNYFYLVLPIRTRY